jgi:RNA polymerase sigma factor (sigma-70 family)
MTDYQLLDAFVRDRSEAAFRALVVRHGPAVLQACRRLLTDPEEIEDAFQATFLVLVRKADQIQDPDTLRNWLYGVALRIANRARRGVARRRDHERRRAEMAPAVEGAGEVWDDGGHLVREELSRLPDSYRAPIELCYMGGLSHEDAARELGWPLGTLKTRLVRGRQQLRGRLERRGVALGLLLLFWSRPPASAAGPALPAELLERTVAAMLSEARGGSPGRSAPTRPGLLGRARERLRRPKVLPGLAPGTGRARPLLFSMWSGSLLLLMLAAGALVLGLAQRSQARAAEFEEFAALPPALTDVLRVECR